jgi:hypothetical protein
MARRPALIKRKTKTVRKTHSEVFLVNRKYLGDEPEKVVTRADLLNATNWYGIMCDRDDAREYLHTWLMEIGQGELAKGIKKIPDTWVPFHVAWQCRIASKHKRTVETDAYDRMIRDIKYAISKGVAGEPEEKPKNVVSIQDRMREKLHDIIGDIEALIDSGESFSLYDWLKKNEIPAMYASKIGEYYAPIVDEFVQAHSGKLDGYENWTKSQLKERMAFYDKIVSDAERYGDVTKKVRKPRKPRAVSVEKKLQHLRYLKESNEFKLASVAPEKILGASEVWLFNTRYKVFTVLRALDRGGLDVNRSTIIKYDEKTSQSKKGGRKPETVLDKIQNGGKIMLRKVLDDLKPDGKIQDRLNEHVIILKVI